TFYAGMAARLPGTDTADAAFRHDYAPLNVPRTQDPKAVADREQSTDAFHLASLVGAGLLAAGALVNAVGISNHVALEAAKRRESVPGGAAVGRFLRRAAGNDLEPAGRGDERDTVLHGWPDPGELPRRAAVCRAEYERSPAGGVPRGHQRRRTKGADLPGLKRRGAGLRPGTGWVRQPRRCAPGLAGVGGAVDSRRVLRVERG